MANRLRVVGTAQDEAMLRPVTGADDDPDAAAVPDRTAALVLLVAGLLGLAAAFVLTVEKFWLLTDPAYTPSCSFGSAVSCEPVMSSPQAAVFGFPNSLLGIAGFAVVTATGAVLLAGGRLARWYRTALLVGATVGALFVAWLIVQSLFVIGALCPYCMVVWACTFTIFWYVALPWSAEWPGAPHPVRSATAFAVRNHGVLLAGWLAAVAALVIVSLAVR